jgi:hypothetical protein
VEQHGGSDDSKSSSRGLHISKVLVYCQLRAAPAMPMLLDPTDKQFLHVAGELTVPTTLLAVEPELPAANTIKKSGCCSMK